MKVFVKRLIFGASARIRFVPILKLVRVIYVYSLLGDRLSSAIERVFDPNNIRRRSSSRIVETRVLTKTITESIFELHLNEHIEWKTFVNGDFDSRCLSILGTLSEKSQSSWTFIDVGANIGTISVPIAKSFRVIAFEPQKNLAIRLNKHFSINNCSDYRVETLGLTSPDIIEKSMQGTLFRPPGNSGATSFIPTWNPSRAEVDVLTVSLNTLDNYRKENGNLFTAGDYFLKIDVEGAELSVLKGAKHFVQDCRPFIFLEYRPDLMLVNISQELIDYICELPNYSVMQLGEVGSDSLIESWNFRASDEEDKKRASDLLLVPSEGQHFFS